MKIGWTHNQRQSGANISGANYLHPREGIRKRGRPPRRWEDDIRKVGGKTWHKVANNR